uniref:Glycine zipper family protein n=1 Tax=Desulfobacca acetoxidans TaxID=60893 RepID=A0A7C3WMH0_9BACT
MQRLTAWLALGCSLIWLGCSTYEPKVVSFKLPEAYANMQRVAGAYVAARAWTDEQEAQNAFGFNILRAGLLPVQVSFDNRGSQTLVIEPSQTFLINQKGEVFPVLDETEAYERVARGTRSLEQVKGLTQGALAGGATGALLGAAIGVVAGHSAGEAAMRGATIGGAVGGLAGVARGTDTDVPRAIAENLSRRNLKNKPIKPGELAYGIILFPREAGSPRALRLQLQDTDTRQTHTLNLPL